MKQPHDADYLARHAEGFDAYLARIREFTPERAGAITGIDAGAIRDLALAYGKTRPALLIAGFGLQRHSHAGQAIRAVSCPGFRLRPRIALRSLWFRF